jgi:hypothetical protein
MSSLPPGATYTPAMQAFNSSMYGNQGQFNANPTGMGGTAVGGIPSNPNSPLKSAALAEAIRSSMGGYVPYAQRLAGIQSQPQMGPPQGVPQAQAPVPQAPASQAPAQPPVPRPQAQPPVWQTPFWKQPGYAAAEQARMIRNQAAMAQTAARAAPMRNYVPGTPPRANWQYDTPQGRAWKAANPNATQQQQYEASLRLNPRHRR